MFYCLFDLINHFRIKYGHSEDEMYHFFREHGVRKSDLMFCKNQCSLDSIPDISKAAQDYSNMTYLEICLSLGYIPEEYRKNFFTRVADISKIISDPENPTNNQHGSIPVYFKTDLGELYNGDCHYFESHPPGGQLHGSLSPYSPLFG